MRDSEKVFYLFFDWVDDLDHLDGADAWKIVKAISEYYRNGTNPLDNVDGPLRVIVSIMFHQIKRKEAVSEIRRQAVNTRYNKQNNFVVQNSTKNINELQPPTTEYDIQNTNTLTGIQSFTLSCAHTCEEEQEDEWIPAEMKNKLEDHLKEQAKQKYLGGTLGQGVVLLSGDQLDALLDELSLEEFDKYVGIIAECELNGKKFKKKTHYQAILDMAKQDRRLQTQEE